MARHLTIRPVYDILKGERRQHGEDLEQGEGGIRRQEALWREQEVKGYVVTSGNEGEEYAWPSFDDIHEISLAAVDNHQGYRDPGLVEGAVGNTQMQQMYGQHEDVFDTAANLITKIQRQQAIVEGNKRTATNVGLAFLANNGYDISPVVDSEQKEDELVRLIMEISTNDDAIGELAQFLRENSVMEKTASAPEIVEEALRKGQGAAFWYDPHSGGLHWGDTHYKIFEGLFHQGDLQQVYDKQQEEQGIFGWVFPEGGSHYYIDFGTDFGYGSNKANGNLQEAAMQAVTHDMGYPPDNSYSFRDYAAERYATERNAGHAYETDDLSGDGLITCQNCGSQIAGDLCGNCGSANLQWWTQGEGLQHFKGSLQKKSVTVEGKNYSCFAFLPPMLYLGNRHHMAIMNQLLQHGWTWETLMAAKQLWGWASDGDGGGGYDENTIGLYLQTDAAILDKSLLPQLEMALTKLTGKSNFVLKSDQEPTNEDYAPDWDSHYGDDGFYSEVPPVLAYNSETGQSEHWDTAHVAAWQEDKTFEELILLDNSWSVGYNTRTSSTWEEQFESPVDEDLGEFEQEEEGLSEEQKKEQGIEGPFEIDGWTVWTRDCDDAYPTHDAIIIDRAKRVMIIGYQGHHADIAANSPFMQNLMMGMSPYDQTAGHFRTEPSKTEPHPTGFLWHGFDANKEEKNVLKQVLRQHYNVDNLKSLYKDIPDAYQEEEYPYYEEDDEGY